MKTVNASGAINGHLVQVMFEMLTLAAGAIANRADERAFAGAPSHA